MEAIRIGVGLLISSTILVIPILGIAFLFLRYELKSRKVRILYFFELVSFFCIIALTTYGLYESKEFANQDILLRINIIPFIGSWSEWKEALNLNIKTLVPIVGNIIIFIPFGFFYSCLTEKRFAFIVIHGLLFTLLIEMMQLFGGRAADIADIILNVMGIMIGYFCFKYFEETNQEMSDFRKKYDKNYKSGKAFLSIWYAIHIFMWIRVMRLI
ncbi:MAG: VanZ family protein [Candidatus Fimousia sp.]